MQELKNYSKSNIRLIAQSLGFVMGAVIGIQRKNKFWGILGWGVLGNIVGYSAGFPIYNLKMKKDEKVEQKKTTK